MLFHPANRDPWEAFHVSPSRLFFALVHERDVLPYRRQGLSVHFREEVHFCLGNCLIVQHWLISPPLKALNRANAQAEKCRKCVGVCMEGCRDGVGMVSERCRKFLFRGDVAPALFSFLGLLIDGDIFACKQHIP
jgi:hypothetical protein